MQAAAVLAMPTDGVDPVLVVRGHEAAGGLAYWRGDFPTCKVEYGLALDLARGIGDRKLIADELYNYAFSFFVNDPDFANGTAAAAGGRRHLPRARRRRRTYERALGRRQCAVLRRAVAGIGGVVRRGARARPHDGQRLHGQLVAPHARRRRHDARALRGRPRLPDRRHRVDGPGGRDDGPRPRPRRLGRLRLLHRRPRAGDPPRRCSASPPGADIDRPGGVVEHRASRRRTDVP